MNSRDKKSIFHWLLTAPIVLLMLFSAFGYISRTQQVVDGAAHLGYPLYFFQFLGVAKLLGAIALLYKRNPKITEWAYAGFSFTFLGAAYSHLSSGDGVAIIATPLVVLALLAGSYATWRR